ncbi:MAG: hypothetical protein JSS82_08115 [Bacteroidetes bacterium]|nr:hypothetical protein [Bacteroidota bacterium]
MRIEHRRHMTRKVKLIPFSKKIHHILIGIGCTNIKCLGYKPSTSSINPSRKGFNGYILKKDTVRQENEKGILEPVYDPNIWKYIQQVDNPHRSSLILAPEDVKVTEANMEYPIHSARIKEMYDHKPKFYLYLGTGYNKEHYRKTGNSLYKRLQAVQTKFPRFVSSKYIK